MSHEIPLAASGLLDTDTRALVLAGFLTFIVPILFICVLSGPERDRVNEFYTAGRRMRPFRGALVLSGVYLSAATVLGTTGSVAVFGYDGLFIALCTVLSLGVLLLLATPLRERVGYTLGDTFALRTPGPAVRIAAAVVTLSACVPYLVVQLSGAGVTTTTLLGLSGPGAEQTAIVMIGLLVVCATVFGGMRGTVVIQVIKTVVLLGAALAVTAVLLHRFHWNTDSLIDAAGRGSGRPDGHMRPGLRFAGSSGPEATLDFIGLMITIVLGVACLPHVALQLNTAPDAATARRTVRHTIVIVGAFCLMLALMGLAAAALIGAPAIMAADPGGNSTLLLLTSELAGGPSTDADGAILVVLVSSAVFLTTLAVVASVTLAAAGAVAHDVYTCPAQGTHDRGPGGGSRTPGIRGHRTAEHRPGGLVPGMERPVPVGPLPGRGGLLSASGPGVLPVLEPLHARWPALDAVRRPVQRDWTADLRSGLLWKPHGALPRLAPQLVPAPDGRPRVDARGLPSRPGGQPRGTAAGAAGHGARRGMSAAERCRNGLKPSPKGPRNPRTPFPCTAVHGSIRGFEYTTPVPLTHPGEPTACATTDTHNTRWTDEDCS